MRCQATTGSIQLSKLWKSRRTAGLPGTLLVAFHHLQGTRKEDSERASHINTAAVDAGLFALKDQITLQPQVRLPSPHVLSPKLLKRTELSISVLSPICVLLAHPHFQMLLKIHEKQTIG